MEFNLYLMILGLFILRLVDGFLEIKQAATKGNNATLLCRFPVYNERVYLVLWKNTKGIQAVCEDSGFCGNITDKRYESTIHTDHSFFFITEADHDIDEGTWSCQINNQLASSTKVIVYSLPASFYIEKPSSQVKEITVTGLDQLELEAVAVCVYPLENNIYLQYKIKGVNSFNYYSEKTVETLSRSGESNCQDHEFVVTARITIMEIDFDGHTIYFQFKYKTTFGYEQDTRRKITAVFQDNLCQSNPCLNGGTCKVSLKQFFCSCPPRFRGEYCEIKVNPCDLDLCRNGATCHSNLDTFQWICKCTSGYTGTLCDTKVTVSSSSNRKTWDPVMLIFPIFILWQQSFESWSFSRCLMIYLCHIMLLSKVNGNADLHNKLLIRPHPTRGAKGVISCRIYAITENVFVQWNHNGIVIMCTLPESTCTHNQFYSASVSSTFSNLTVWKANFSRDNGLWTCTVNNLTSDGTLYVVTEPRKFVIEEETHLKSPTRNNWTISADAYCVYPDSAHAYLLYQVKGDAHYQQFKRRNISLNYDHGERFGCEQNEYVLRATGMIKLSDFSSELLVRFKFLYISMSGKKYYTRGTDFIKFTDDPCHSVSCKNGGLCTFDAKQAYKCICANLYSGKHCENSPPLLHSSTYSKKDAKDDVCCWILIPCIVLAFVFGIVAVYMFKKARKKSDLASLGRDQELETLCNLDIQRNADRKTPSDSIM